MIKKSREYPKIFLKFNRDWKLGQAWCANICYHALDDNVETTSSDNVKIAIYGLIDVNLRTRVLHPKPRTIGFTKF